MAEALFRDREKARNPRKSRIRSRVEHVFKVMKHVFGWRKTRFRRIFKNLQYALGVASAVNIYLHRWAILRSMTLPGAG
ncbi:transposase [Thermopirellula anaerolimosa]